MYFYHSMCIYFTNAYKITYAYSHKSKTPLYPRMKLPQNGTVSWRLDWPKQWTDWTSNIEHPTSNVEYWWRYALSISKQANRRISKSRFALLSLFFKIDRIHYSMLDVQRSMFDNHKLLFLIRPAVVWANGWAAPWTLNPWTLNLWTLHYQNYWNRFPTWSLPCCSGRILPWGSLFSFRRFIWQPIYFLKIVNFLFSDWITIFTKASFF